MMNMDLDQKHPAQKIDRNIDLFMSAYIMGEDITKMKMQALENTYNNMNYAYPGWENTRKFTREIRRKKFEERDLTFKEVIAVLTQITDEHGSWQQKECLDMKQQLIGLESQKDGCVSVSHFYKGMKDQGKWQFSESPDYLRELGALDDSNPQNLRVIIPNYLDGLSNCVASSSYYSVCCINECEEVLSRIEKHFQAPDASPKEIAELVPTLASSTMPTNRRLPPAMAMRLEEIAGAHDGRVPLHSRLFMQWMHNAYPHECPYPHMSGKTYPRLPEVWMAQEHKDPTVSRSQMNRFAMQPEDWHNTGQCGQWLGDEELYVPWQGKREEQEAQNAEHVWWGATLAALVAAAASMLLVVVQSAKTLDKIWKNDKMNKMLMA